MLGSRGGTGIITVIAGRLDDQIIGGVEGDLVPCLGPDTVEAEAVILNGTDSCVSKPCPSTIVKIVKPPTGDASIGMI